MNILEIEDLLISIFELLDLDSQINYFLSFAKSNSRMTRKLEIQLKSKIESLENYYSPIIPDIFRYINMYQFFCYLDKTLNNTYPQISDPTDEYLLESGLVDQDKLLKFLQAKNSGQLSKREIKIIDKLGSVPNSE